MVREVKWTNRALKDRIQILSYWLTRNKSNSYSLKLDDLFIETLQSLCKFPYAGRKTEKRDVRIKVVKNYLLIYRITATRIVILRLWDTRQNPQKLKY